MTTFDERLMRWTILGVGSGTPLCAETAAAVMNELHSLEPDCLRIGFLGALNGILGREDPCGSGVAAIIDNLSMKVIGFVAVKLDHE